MLYSTRRRKKKGRIILIIFIILLILGVAVWAIDRFTEFKILSFTKDIIPTFNQAIEPTPTPLPTTAAVTATTAPPTPSPVPRTSVEAKGIYISGIAAGRSSVLNELVEMINATELNAAVIDVKDDKGKVSYYSNVPYASFSNATEPFVKDMETVVNNLNNANIYTIGRIVCFKDNTVCENKPELSVKDKNGNVWRDGAGFTWLNPYNKESWEYLIDLAREAVQLGFKEIQFDYVRFPSEGAIDNIDYGENSEMPKSEIVAQFLREAKSKLEPLGAFVSADVFGVVALNSGDSEGIGQDWTMMGKETDYLSPMVYPSHYANKSQNGQGQNINGNIIEAPDYYPYDVVYNTLLVAKKNLADAGVENVKIRPYLQDFTANWLARGYYKQYTANDVKMQIRAVKEAGINEWILWNSTCVYSKDALEPSEG